MCRTLYATRLPRPLLTVGPWRGALVQGRTESGIEMLEAAVELDPCWCAVLLTVGGFLAISGRPEDAIAYLEQAKRLNPRDPHPGRVLFNLGVAQFAAGRDRACIETIERGLESRSDPLALALLAAAHAHLGEDAAARHALDENRELLPGVSLSLVRAHPILVPADPAFLERLLDGLRRAGLED